MQLLPAIDLRAGRCVRLYQGKFAAETCYDTQPRGVLRAFRALGARMVHVVDLDGARDGVRSNAAAIADLAREPGVRLQVGGGVRSASDVALLLDAGVARVVVGSAAVQQPAQVAGWLEDFGPERMCLAFDVRLTAGAAPQVHTHGWTQVSQRSLWDALPAFAASGLRHVLCTDIDRDGTLTGPSFALYRAAVRRFPHLAWQASGGIRTAGDLQQLARLGLAAAISGKALLEQRITQQELRPYWHDASSPASTCAPDRL